MMKRTRDFQPPSGGCVLKPTIPTPCRMLLPPAAFGRLCVETGVFGHAQGGQNPAAFGRLCVETYTG